MSLEEAKEEGPLAVVSPSFCKEHEGEMLKLFCETCDEAICRDCTIVKHRDHKYTFVKDAFAKEKDGVMKILSEAKIKKSTVKDSLDDISVMKRSIQYRAEQVVQNITKCFDDLTVDLKTRHAELVSGVEELKKAKMKALEIQQGKLETALVSIQSSVEFTEKAFKNGSEVEILNMHKQMSTRLQELNSAKWQLDPCADDAMTFKADKKLQLKQEIGAFGAITDVVTHAGTSTLTMGHGSEGVMYNTLRGQQIEFTIIAKERNGKKRTEGGDLFTVSCVGGTVDRIQSVRDCGDGTYSFSYIPQQEGQFLLSVLETGHHVQRSPFTWFVGKWNLMPGISLGGNKGQVQLSKEKLTAQYIYNDDGLSDSEDDEAISTSEDDDELHDVEPKCGQPWYVVGSRSFNGGKYLWKTKLLGNVSKDFSIGVINTSRISGKQVKPGNWWVWNATSRTSSSANKRKSTVVTNYASKDIIEMYLDCDNGTLMMYNHRTKKSNLRHGVKSEVSPVFQMTTDGQQVSLQV